MKTLVKSALALITIAMVSTGSMFAQTVVPPTSSQPSPVVKWKVATDMPQNWHTNLRAGYGSVFVTSDPGSLGAFDAQTGQLRWRYDAGLKGDTSVSPLVADSLVLTALTAEVQVDQYSTQQIAFVIAVDAETGAERWRFQTDGHNVSASSVTNDIVYFGTDAKDYNEYSQVPPAGYIYALRVSTGKLLWRLPLPEASVSQTPIATGSALYFIADSQTSSSSVLHAISANNQKEMWNLQVCAYGKGPIVANGILYVECFDRLQAISTQSGRCLWNLTVPSDGPHDIGVSDCARVAEQTPTTQPTQPNTSPTPAPAALPQLPYDLPGPANGLNTMPLVVDDTLFIGVVTNVDLLNTPSNCPYTVDSYILALDSRTGREKWRFRSDDAIRSDLAVADGAVYFNTSPCFEVMGGPDDDYVYAVDMRTGNLRWRFHHTFSEDGPISGSLASLNGSLYFATDGGSIFALLTTLPGMPTAGGPSNQFDIAFAAASTFIALGLILVRLKSRRATIEQNKHI